MNKKNKLITITPYEREIMVASLFVRHRDLGPGIIRTQAEVDKIKQDILDLIDKIKKPLRK